MDFRLLYPHEVVEKWDALLPHVQRAVAQDIGERTAEDIRASVLSHKAFMFAGFEGGEVALACAAEFVVYPRTTKMVVTMASGELIDPDLIWQVVSKFAKSGGASAVQGYCRGEARVRHFSRVFDMTPQHTILERQLWAAAEAADQTTTKTKTGC